MLNHRANKVGVKFGLFQEGSENLHKGMGYNLLLNVFTYVLFNFFSFLFFFFWATISSWQNLKESAIDRGSEEKCPHAIGPFAAN